MGHLSAYNCNFGVSTCVWKYIYIYIYHSGDDLNTTFIFREFSLDYRYRHLQINKEMN